MCGRLICESRRMGLEKKLGDIMGGTKGNPKGNLTSEKLKACFPNQFDLVTRAIECARGIIRSENRPPVDGENQNVAAQAIAQLEYDIEHKDD